MNESISHSISAESLESLSVPQGELFEKWGEGIDHKEMTLKPLGDKLQDFYTSEEIEKITKDKTSDEARSIIEKNRKAILKNNAEIERVSERILDIYELNEQELTDLYHGENTSDSDKSIIAAIGTIRKVCKGKPENLENPEGLSEDEKTFYQNALPLMKNYNGFRMIFVREQLNAGDHHFQLLTKTEREEGTLEDIASIALETFAMNPNYSLERAHEYDDFLYGIMLDCTKRAIVGKKDTKTIKEEVDLEEFQDRIMESMSGSLLNIGNLKGEYTMAEYKAMHREATALSADIDTWHHFETDREKNPFVKISNEETPRGLFDDVDKEKKDYKDRVRRNNREVFKYEEELAREDVKPWVDRIDVSLLDAINSEKGKTYAEKLSAMAEHIQEVFEIKNLGESGDSRPIEIKWFRYKKPLVIRAAKKVLKLFGIHEENDLPERKLGEGAYYESEEKAIYYPITKQSFEELSAGDVDLLAHELWHAKQNETQENPEESQKARMYRKNVIAYVDDEGPRSEKRYYRQIMEREAYAVGSELMKRLEEA